MTCAAGGISGKRPELFFLDECFLIRYDRIKNTFLPLIFPCFILFFFPFLVTWHNFPAARRPRNRGGLFMDLKTCYAVMGADYEDVIRRLSTEDRVVRFLTRLPDDGSFAALQAALDRQDYQEAFRYAHTIKGICLNLGLTTLLQSSSALADNLRAGQADSNTPALFQALRRDYEDAVTAIRSLSGF